MRMYQSAAVITVVLGLGAPPLSIAQEAPFAPVACSICSKPRTGESKPGIHPWKGEHVGKWLHAATLADVQPPYSPFEAR